MTWMGLCLLLSRDPILFRIYTWDAHRPMWRTPSSPTGTLKFESTFLCVGLLCHVKGTRIWILCLYESWPWLQILAGFSSHSVFCGKQQQKNRNCNFVDVFAFHWVSLIYGFVVGPTPWILTSCKGVLNSKLYIFQIFLRASWFWIIMGYYRFIWYSSSSSLRINHIVDRVYAPVIHQKLENEAQEDHSVTIVSMYKHDGLRSIPRLDLTVWHGGIYL